MGTTDRRQPEGDVSAMVILALCLLYFWVIGWGALTALKYFRELLGSQS